MGAKGLQIDGSSTRVPTLKRADGRAIDYFGQKPMACLASTKRSHRDPLAAKLALGYPKFNGVRRTPMAK